MTPTTHPAVLAEGLRKRYGTTSALDGFDLTVPHGTVHGLLGPNGAGKTTAVRILATLLRFDGGHARVAGADVATQAARVRTRIGLAGQHAAVDDVLTGRQNLEMFGRLSHLTARDARRRATELLERFSLAEVATRPARTYSGGMRRRLDLAASMLLAPTVLFLDEPTTGLDPRSRSEVWDAVRGLVADGTTVLLTTQYLEEADQLASRISIIDRGRVITQGTPEALKSTVGGDQIDVVAARTEQLPAVAAAVGRVAGMDPEVDPATRRVSAPVRSRVTALTGLVGALQAAGLEVEDIELRRPTLDDVFLRLTGHRAAPDDEDEDDEHAEMPVMTAAAPPR